jgi:hypothetical protein
MLARLFASTLDEIFMRVRALSGAHPFAPNPTYTAIQESCACGRNPLLAYYPSCEQALIRTLLDLADPTGDRSVAAVIELQAVVRAIATRDVATFCSLCQRRQSAGASAAGAGEQGKLEFFPMTPEFADSWLARAHLDRQPMSPADGPNGGRRGRANN